MAEELRECPNYLVINKGQQWTCDEIFDPDLYEMVIPLHEYSSQREDALIARIAELEKELAETEGYPGIAADMLKLKTENSRLVELVQETRKQVKKAYKEGHLDCYESSTGSPNADYANSEARAYLTLTATRNENDT